MYQLCLLSVFLLLLVQGPTMVSFRLSPSQASLLNYIQVYLMVFISFATSFCHMVLGLSLLHSSCVFYCRTDCSVISRCGVLQYITRPLPFSSGGSLHYSGPKVNDAWQKEEYLWKKNNLATNEKVSWQKDCEKNGKKKLYFPGGSLT